MKMSEMVGWSACVTLYVGGLHLYLLACVCLCMRMQVVGGLCCFSTYVGFSICRLCCYRCVSMETLPQIAALKPQPDLAVL